MSNRIRNIKAKIEREIKWAKKNGLEITDGLFYDDGRFCAIGALAVRQLGEDEFRNAHASTDNDKFDKIVQRCTGFTAGEVRYFTTGFDDCATDDKDLGVGMPPTPSRLAAYRAGVSLRAKYID